MRNIVCNLLIKYFFYQKNEGKKIDLQSSFYCGDAAGREKNWAPKMKKDHSVGDRLFALNIGLIFKTPEEHFMNARAIAGKMPEFDPRNIKTLPLLEPKTSNITSGKQEVNILSSASWPQIIFFR